MAVIRVFGDDTGETHLETIEVPRLSDISGNINRLRDVPATKVSVASFPDGLPD